MVFKQTKYHLSKIIIIFSLILCLLECEKRPPMPPPPFPASNGKIIEMNGKVINYKTNPEGNIDKIILNQGNQRSEIHFPPHLAKHILEIAKINTSVQIKTFQRHRDYELTFISSADGKTVFDAKEILPPRPSPGKEIQIRGSVSELIRNRDNEVTGFVIGKKTVILHPEESRTLAPLLIDANEVEVTALERYTKDGTINTFQFPPVMLTKIKIDSIVYKIR